MQEFIVRLYELRDIDMDLMLAVGMKGIVVKDREKLHSLARER